MCVMMDRIFFLTLTPLFFALFSDDDEVKVWECPTVPIHDHRSQQLSILNALKYITKDYCAAARENVVRCDKNTSATKCTNEVWRAGRCRDVSASAFLSVGMVCCGQHVLGACVYLLLFFPCVFLALTASKIPISDELPFLLQGNGPCLG